RISSSSSWRLGVAPCRSEGYSWKKLRPARMPMSPNPYRKSSSLSRGTESSNPPCSSVESSANCLPRANMSRFWSSLTHDLRRYVPGEQPHVQELVKLNTNESPIGPSPRVLEAIRAEAAETLR